MVTKIISTAMHLAQHLKEMILSKSFEWLIDNHIPINPHIYCHHNSAKNPSPLKIYGTVNMAWIMDIKGPKIGDGALGGGYQGFFRPIFAVLAKSRFESGLFWQSHSPQPKIYWVILASNLDIWGTFSDYMTAYWIIGGPPPTEKMFSKSLVSTSRVWGKSTSSGSANAPTRTSHLVRLRGLGSGVLILVTITLPHLPSKL